MSSRFYERLAISMAALVLFASFATADIVNQLWCRTVDFANQNDYGYECAIDSQGSVILAGQNHRGPTGASDGRNAFVIKYDASGGLLWSNEVGNTTAALGPDAFYSMRVDADDNVYAAGTLGGNNSYPPHQLCLIDKFTPTGTLAWQRSYCVYAWAENMGLALDPSGNPVAVGREFINFSASQGDWVVQKYSGAGTQQSGYPFYYNHAYGLVDRAHAVAVWTNGDFTVAGFVSVSSANSDWHVRHYSAARVLQWSDTFDPGGSSDNAVAVNYDSLGNPVVGGYTRNPTGADSDWRIIKYQASDGSRMWSMRYESNANASESLSHLVIDEDDNILAVGGWQRADGQAVPVLHLISGVDGSIIESQLWTNATDRVLSHVDLRDGMVALCGYVTDGNDWDMFVSLNTMEDVEPPAVVLSSLFVAQRPGTKLVDITYDLSSNVTNLVEVTVTVSNASGVVSSPSLSGDAGADVPTGSGRHVVWDAGTDQPGLLLDGLRVVVEGSTETNGTALWSTTFSVDSRDYHLAVASGHGSPAPSVGVHSNYCWRSGVTCSVESVASESGVEWSCDGWSGSGSVPASGGTNDTGEIVLTNLVSSITWNWSIITIPAPEVPDLTVDAGDFRILDFTGTQIYNPLIGESVSFEISVHNTGDADAPGNILVQIFEAGSPPDLANYDSNAFIVVASGLITNAIPPGGSGTILLPWAVQGPDRLATMTAVAEFGINRAQSQANAEGPPADLPAEEFSFLNNGVGRSIEIGTPPGGVTGIDVLTSAPAGMLSGVSYALEGTARYDWGAMEPVLGALVTVSVNGEDYEDRTVSPDGGWNVQLNGLPEGEHIAHVAVDDGHLIGTTNLTLTVGPGPPGTDLRVDWIGCLSGAYRNSGQIGYAVTGSPVVVTALIRNNGNTDSGPFDVAFRDPSGTVYCTEPASIGAFSYTWVTASTGYVVQAGANLMRVTADSANVVIESSEGNNTGSTIVYGRVPKPDLAVPDLAWSPSEPKSGDIMTLTATIINQGAVAVPAGTSFATSFSLGGATNITLSADLDRWETRTVEVTWSAVAGTYVLAAAADSGDAIAEDFEDNNTRSETFTVREALPDLRPFYYLHGYESPSYYRSGLAFVPSEPTVGEIISVSCDIYNNGTVPLSVGSTFDVVFAAEDVPFATNTVTLLSELAAGAKITVAESWSGAAEGTVNFSAVVDVGSTVPEENESNNDTTADLSVFPSGAGLEVAGLSFSPLQPLPGTAVILTATVQNNGGAAGGSGSVVQFFAGTTNLADKIGQAVLTVDVAPFGGTETVSLAWTSPGISGDVPIVAMAGDSVFERALAVTPDPSPNLQVFSDDITVAPAVPHSGESVTVRSVIRNTEGNPATDFQVQFYVDSASGAWVELGAPVAVTNLNVGAVTTVTAPATILAVRTAYKVRVEILPDPAQGDADPDDNIATSSFLLYGTPVADAGPDRSCIAGQTVALDGSASSNALTYAWTLIAKPAGSTALLSGDRTPSPSLTTDVAGDYMVELTVTKGTAVSAPDRVTVSADWLILQVASEHGVADPAVGTLNCIWEQSVECLVSGVETIGTTQYVNKGWVGTGSVPASGSTSNVTITITNNSSVTWQWTTNYWLDVNVNGDGRVEVTSDPPWSAPAQGGAFEPAGTNRVLTAVPNEHHHFVVWAGDTDAIVAGGVSNENITVAMDGPVALTATFAIDTYPVIFELGIHGTRSGGGETNQIVAHGGAAIAPVVAPDPGWSFDGWDAAFNSVTGPLIVQAQYTRIEHTLTVEPLQGNPDPAAGTHTYFWGESVECRVSGVEVMGATQYVAAGWVGTGSVPASGIADNVTFTITNDSSIAWLWQTNYMLNVGIAAGEGATSVTSEWYVAGTDAEVEAFAAEGYRFDAWSVDGHVPPYGGITNLGSWLQVPMNGAHTVAVSFVVLDLPEALDNWSLNFTTGGDTNWLPQVEESADGIDAAATAPVGDSSECWIQTVVTNSGTLSFDWRVSCQERYDSLLLYIDGFPEARLSGESGWQSFSIFLGAGEHTIRWIYRKGVSGSAGQDRAWLDRVSWVPGVPQAEWTLTVASADGAGNPVPSVGEHTYTNGEVVTASIVTPYTVVPNAERRLCTGWSCTGLAPYAGSGTNVTLTMTSDAELTWLWNTQYWLDTEAGAGGAVNVDDRWCDAGADITVTAMPMPGYAFIYWTGELVGASFDGASVTVAMDRARGLTAVFIDLAEALDTTNLVWTVSGDAGWMPQTDVTSDGVDAGASGVIGDFGLSRVQTEVSGPGLLTFNWRVSCEEGYDWFDFLVDGELADMLTGESGWQSVSIRVLGSGVHQLAWEYWKDEVLSNGYDRAWLDQVQWSPFTGFELWVAERGMSGDLEALFAGDYNSNGIADGFEYAFGANFEEGDPLMDIRIVDGIPLVGIPVQDAATLPYVEIRLKGTTGLSSGIFEWTLPLVITTAPPDNPDNRVWYRPQGAIPSAAFFMLEAEL